MDDRRISLEVLTAQLKEQAKRINEIPAEAFENKLRAIPRIGNSRGALRYDALS